MGIIEAIENYKPIPDDTPEPEWITFAHEFFKKHDLWDMSRVPVKVACGYGVIYATDEAIEAAERFCCDNWQHWLEGITRNV